MKNKTIFLMCLGLLAFQVSGFAYDDQGPPPVTNVSLQNRVNQKVIFDHDQAIYNNKANTAIRANNSAEKNQIKHNQEKKKVEDHQDKTKGQLLIKF